MEALQDEQWDIIFMQSACCKGGTTSVYNSDWQVVADYLMNNQDIAPTVLKHKNSKFPAADADGNYVITEDMKEDLIESVNWALRK